MKMSQEYEIRLKYKTKSGKYEEIKDSQPSPQNRQRVYFTCHPDDFDKYFDEITNEILSRQPNNTCIYFYDEETDNEEERDFDLNQMILFVIPVTYNFICDDNCQARKDFKFAEENNISMLLLQQDYGLEEEFNRKCGEYQMLSKFPSLQNSQFYDPTAITYEEKLTRYLESKILGDDLIKEIQDAFDAYIFLSYRKKDRKHAQELMKLIHSNDFCRDIAIWYDEFLVSGENFNDAIKDAMEKSNLFSMVVTRGLFQKGNYIEKVEYPLAKGEPVKIHKDDEKETKLKNPKTIFPVNMELNENELQELKTPPYNELPDVVDAYGENFSDELLKTVQQMAKKANNKDPKHNYLIGLAYLNGIDVEKNEDRGIELITSAAEAGLPEAMEKLYEIFQSGDIVNADYEKARMWLQLLIEKSNDYNCNSEDTLKKYCRRYYELAQLLRSTHGENADLYYKKSIEEVSKLLKYNSEGYSSMLASIYNGFACLKKEKGEFDEAIEYHRKAYEIREQLYNDNHEKYSWDFSSSLNNLGVLYKALGKYDEGEAFLKKALELRKVELSQTEESYAYENIAETYNNLGTLYVLVNKKKEAEYCFLEAIRVCDSLLKKRDNMYNELNLMQVRSNYANLLILEKKYDIAENEIKACRKSIKKYFDLNENVCAPFLINTNKMLALLYKEKGYHRKSADVYRVIVEQLSKYQELVPGLEFIFIDCYYALALLILNYNNPAGLIEAEKYAIQGIKICEKNIIKGSSKYYKEYVELKTVLGDVYVSLSQDLKAKQIYLEALENCKFLRIESDKCYMESMLYYSLGCLAIQYNIIDAKKSIKKAIEIIKPYIDKEENFGKAYVTMIKQYNDLQ